VTIKDNPNWRRHKGACANYRERWTALDETDDDGRVLLYQIVCLMDTPPIDADEQRLCMCATHGCWRLAPRDTPTARGKRDTVGAAT
jgi:hypothetical protein